MSSNITQVSRVRALYKAILKIHRSLPSQMQALGDQYVKDEFRKHKKATNSEADIFIEEWTKYYLSLAQQMSKKMSKVNIGQHISPELLDCLATEQLGQLHQLLQETQKPLDSS